MQQMLCAAMPTVLPLCQDRHRPTSAAAPDPPPSWKLLLHLLPTWQCVAGPVDMCDANLQDTMLTHISRPYLLRLAEAHVSHTIGGLRPNWL